LRGCVHVDQRQAPNTCATNSFLAPHRLWHLLGDARGAPLTLYSGVFDEMQHVPLAMMDFFSASAPIMMLAFSLLHRTTLGGGRYAAGLAASWNAPSMPRSHCVPVSIHTDHAAFRASNAFARPSDSQRRSRYHSVSLLPSLQLHLDASTALKNIGALRPVVALPR
jgi:hypothetical protein